MEKTTAETCPLCIASAVFYPVDYGNRKYYNCPNCGPFQVGRLAGKKLVDAPKQWLDVCADKARKTPAGHLLVIVVPPIGQETNAGSVGLVADFVPKSELPL